MMLRVHPASRAFAAASALACSLPLSAQIHRLQKSEPVTRAIAVYEYAGDLKKPTAARLIPVSLFIGGHYEDAGTYLARPIPFALGTDTVYELQNSGTPLGTLDLAFAKNLRGSSAEMTVPYDQAWFGYGRFTPAKTTPPSVPKADARHTQHAYAVQDDGKPHVAGGKPDSNTTARDRRDTTDVDPAADRAERVSLPNDRDPDAPNPDRPTLRRRPQDTTGGPKGKRPKDTASVSDTPVSPDKDPDRPTIKRKEAASSEDDIPPDPAEVSSRRSTHGLAGTVSAAQAAAANGVLSDNGRPELRRNSAATPNAPAVTQAAALADLQKVAAPGLPPDLHFVVAVSDMKDRPAHDFSAPFKDEAERTTAMTEMRSLALEVLHKPSLATDASGFTQTTPPAQPATAATQRSASQLARTAARTRTTRPARASVAHAASDILENEQLRAFNLSFSAPLTYVYTAQTASDPVRFVTVVAQRNLDGMLDIGLRSVTDTAHLDRTPRYRLVDAVDADATNRAGLLFETRNNTSRQFALYRFLGPKPDEVFLTGTTK